MPLTQRDRQLLSIIDRLKIYLLLLGAAVLIYILCTPVSELQLATSIIGIALCGVFWLTQRLLSFISTLDMELQRVVTTLQHTLPEEQRKELFR